MIKSRPPWTCQLHCPIRMVSREKCARRRRRASSLLMWQEPNMRSVRIPRSTEMLRSHLCEFEIFHCVLLDHEGHMAANELIYMMHNAFSQAFVDSYSWLAHKMCRYTDVITANSLNGRRLFVNTCHMTQLLGSDYIFFFFLITISGIISVNNLD